MREHLKSNEKILKKSFYKMGPEPRFEPESRDPQSRRMTTYPTPAENIKNKKYVKMREQGFEPW